MTPQRTCLGCRRRDDQVHLMRLVRLGDEIVDGTRPRLPGRGSYLHPDPSCVEVAQRRRAFQRAFGPGARTSESLATALARITPGWIQTPPAG